MSLKDRIGFDAGKTRLEHAIQWAIDNKFFFLDFNADAGRNHMDTFAPERSREVSEHMQIERYFDRTAHSFSRKRR